MNKPRVRVLMASKTLLDEFKKYWWLKKHLGGVPLSTMNPSGQVNYFIYLTKNIMDKAINNASKKSFSKTPKQL